MLIFSIVFLFAFPTSEFLLGIPDRRVLENMRDSLFTITDIVEAFQHNFFNVSANDYALQRSESEAASAANIKFFGGDKVALEAAERYRGRSKRLAFNSLLRGSKPIAAGLRKTVARSSSSSSSDSERGYSVAEDEEDIRAATTNPLVPDADKRAAEPAHTTQLYNNKKPVPLLAPPPLTGPTDSNNNLTTMEWSEFI